MRLHSYKWNQRQREYTTVILTTADIINNNFDQLCGAGYEILVLPVAYRETTHQKVNDAKFMVEARNGEIVYV